MWSFITGSHAYGVPHESSDIDLCVLVTKEEADLLWANSGSSKEGASVRYGKLNLVVFTNLDQYLLWQKLTNELIERKPVTRDEAVALFQANGFGDYGA